jgi:hypothetical protein
MHQCFHCNELLVVTVQFQTLLKLRLQLLLLHTRSSYVNSCTANVEA